jgi:tetratricopeptide (TPR) repeat protein
VIRKKKRRPGNHASWKHFSAEAAYADSIFRSGLGDFEGSIASLEQAFELMPTYAPAMLSMGSVHSRRGKKSEGRKLLFALLNLPADTEYLCELLDEAGTFLIEISEYADGLELYQQAIVGFPNAAVLYQGLGCCAGHEGLLEEAVQASRRAVELEPANQKTVNDLGWSLLEKGDLIEARATLERAVEMDPSDELAQENLRYCLSLIQSQGENTTIA